MAKEDKEPTIVTETYINEDFQKSCDEHDLDKLDISSNGLGSGNGGEDCNTFTDSELDANVVSNGNCITCLICLSYFSFMSFLSHFSYFSCINCLTCPTSLKCFNVKLV
jgi:hypothetical protein